MGFVEVRYREGEGLAGTATAQTLAGLEERNNANSHMGQKDTVDEDSWIAKQSSIPTIRCKRVMGDLGRSPAG